MKLELFSAEIIFAVRVHFNLGHYDIWRSRRVETCHVQL